MKTYNYILLDWDGNLAKTLDIWLEAFRFAYTKIGITLSDEEIARTFGQFDRYCAEHGVADPAAAYNLADGWAQKRLPSVELYPDALEVLQYFKTKGKKTALITSSSHTNVGHLLDRYNLRGYFDTVIASEDVTTRKPNPEALLKALERLGGNVDEAVMIGDSDKDISAAVNAGVDSVLFYPPEHAKFYDLAKLKALKPTHIVDDFRSIKNIVV